jgi:hypothetical protein
MHRNQTSLHGGNLLAQNSLQEVRIGGFQLRFLHFVAHFGLFYVTLPTQTFGGKLALYSGRITVIQPVSRITVIRDTAARSLRDTAVSRITYHCITQYTTILEKQMHKFTKIQVLAQKSDLFSWGQPACSKCVTGCKIPVEIFRFL